MIKVAFGDFTGEKLQECHSRLAEIVAKRYLTPRQLYRVGKENSS